MAGPVGAVEIVIPGTCGAALPGGTPDPIVKRAAANPDELDPLPLFFSPTAAA